MTGTLCLVHCTALRDDQSAEHLDATISRGDGVRAKRDGGPKIDPTTDGAATNGGSGGSGGSRASVTHDDGAVPPQPDSGQRDGGEVEPVELDGGCGSERVLCDGGCVQGYADCTDSATRCATELSVHSSCGSCDSVCMANEVCSPAVGAQTFSCVTTCTAPFPDSCAGACTDFQSDDDNCGGCGESHACPDALSCQQGQCRCPEGTLDCGDGSCQLPSADNSCGAACNVPCPSPTSHGTPACDGSRCTIECEDQYRECDGQCASVTATEHCGGCGNACDTVHSSGPSCGGTSCSYSGCAPGWGDCSPASPNLDGCETSLGTAANCGVCGRACSLNRATSATCNAGVCAPVCEPGRQDCVKPAAPLADDGCECAGTACCGTGCQTSHDNGEGKTFYSCVGGFTGVHDTDETFAGDACRSVDSVHGGCWSCWSRSLGVVCSRNFPRCWGFSGTYLGKLFSWSGTDFFEFDCRAARISQISTWR
jgi:hypothetical protein